MKKNLKFLSNNWVVTLTATLIGVFAALYLNELVASHKLEEKKAIAKQNIFKEIEENRRSLEKNIVKLEKMLDVINFLDPKMDEENGLISSPDSIAFFKSKHPEILKIEDSIKVDNGIYSYNGEIDIDFNISHINLTTLSLKTLKNSGLSSSFDFNCLMNLERLEKFTNEILEKEKKTLEELFQTIGKKITKEFTDQLKLLISYDRTLLEFYSESEKNLKNCG